MIAKRTRVKIRQEEGFQLVELLITVGIVTTFSTAIMGTMASLYRLNTSNHNQAIATMIIQEVMDNARNMSWSESGGLRDETVFPREVWINLIVNQVSSGGAQPPPSFPRALMIDTLSKTYSSVAQNKLFRGTVRQKLQDLGNNQLKLTVEVSYPIENSGITKTVTASTNISQYGLHN